MATVNFSVPDEVKAEFDKTFGDQNKSSIIAELMRRGRARASAPDQAKPRVPPIEQRASKPAFLQQRRGAQGALCRPSMIVVLDASVILKWLIEDPLREPDTAKASALMESVVEGELEILQPVHWLAEVAAVAARLAPATAVRDVELIAALDFPTTDDPDCHCASD